MVPRLPSHTMHACMRGHPVAPVKGWQRGQALPTASPWRTLACAPCSNQQSDAGETPNRESHTCTLHTIHACICIHVGTFSAAPVKRWPCTVPSTTASTTADMPALTVCVCNPMWLSLCGWRRSIVQRRPHSEGAGVLASTTHHVHLRPPQDQHVGPKDERLGIVILDWYPLRA